MLVRTQMTRSPASLVMMNSIFGVMLENLAATMKELLMTSVLSTVRGQPPGKELHPLTTSAGSWRSSLKIAHWALTRVVKALAGTETGSSADRVMVAPLTTTHSDSLQPSTSAQLGVGPPALPRKEKGELIYYYYIRAFFIKKRLTYRR